MSPDCHNLRQDNAPSRQTQGAQTPAAAAGGFRPSLITAKDVPGAALIQALGWLDPAQTLTASAADDAAVARYYRPEEILAARQQSSFAAQAQMCGGSLCAAERVAAYPGLVCHPASSPPGGILDPAVLAIVRLLDRRVTPVLYIQFDAIANRAVIEAFAGSSEVMVLSVRPNANKSEFPGEFLLAAGASDTDLDHLVTTALLPQGQAFAPSALVIRLNPWPGHRQQALWRAVISLLQLADRQLLLGATQTHPVLEAWHWAGLWGMLTGRRIPQPLPAAANALLNRLTKQSVLSRKHFQ